MTEAFHPTPVEFEAIVRFRAESRIRAKLHRLEVGTTDPTDDLVIQEATERLGELVEEIGEEVEQIVSEVEEEYREAVGDEVWRVLNHGTPEEQAAFAEARQRQEAPIQLHNVIGATGTDHWLHTHGMDRLGLPELEVRGVPSFFVDAAAQALRHVSRYMQQPGVKVRLGETMQIGPMSGLRFEKLPPIPGNEDHYEVERWAFVPVGMTCHECGDACAGHASES